MIEGYIRNKAAGSIYIPTAKAVSSHYAPPLTTSAWAATRAPEFAGADEKPHKEEPAPTRSAGEEAHGSRYSVRYSFGLALSFKFYSPHVHLSRTA